MSSQPGVPSGQIVNDQAPFADADDIQFSVRSSVALGNARTASRCRAAGNFARLGVTRILERELNKAGMEVHPMIERKMGKDY